MRRKLIAGNWKMYKTTAEALSFTGTFLSEYKEGDHEVALCVPFTQLSALKTALKDSGVKLGAQNVHFAEEGAYTGEISPPMLTEIGVDYVVLGHSERRQYYGESDEAVNLKLKAVWGHGLNPILCVGESLEQRDGGQAQDVVASQVRNGLKDISGDLVSRLVVAYEPVWAIGTGRTATPEQAEEMCAFIRETVSGLYGQDVAGQVRIQYGGSVKPSNAEDILTRPNIDGALVGGASLVPADFLAIIRFGS